MKARKNELLQAAGAAPGDDGVTHALTLLLLAVSRTNSSVGALLDEFTAMHADYLSELRDSGVAADQVERIIKAFQAASKDIYKQLSALESEQAVAERREVDSQPTSARVH